MRVMNFQRTLKVGFFLWLAFSLKAASQTSDLMLLPTLTPVTITFEEAAKSAVEKTSDIRKSEQRILIAKNESFIATSKLLPKVSGILSYAATDKLGAANKDETTSALMRVSFSLLDTKALLEMRAKRESLTAAKTSHLLQQDTVINTVGSAYIDALIAQSKRDIAFFLEQQHQRSLSMFERKAALGLVRSLDVTTARYRANKAHSDYLLKDQVFQKRMGELGKKIGMREMFLLSMVSIESPHLGKTNDELVALALTAKDLKKLREEISSQEYSVLSEKFDFLPKLSANLDSGWQMPYEQGNLANKRMFSTKVMVNLEIPLFSGGSTLASIKSKNAQKTINEITLRSMSGGKVLKVHGLKEQIKNLNVAIKSAELAFEAATKARESAERLFEKNEATGLELVEANTNYFNAQHQIMNAKLQLEYAKLRLLFSIGRIKEVLQ